MPFLMDIRYSRYVCLIFVLCNYAIAWLTNWCILNKGNRRIYWHLYLSKYLYMNSSHYLLYVPVSYSNTVTNLSNSDLHVYMKVHIQIYMCVWFWRYWWTFIYIGLVSLIFICIIYQILCMYIIWLWLFLYQWKYCIKQKTSNGQCCISLW